MFNTNNFDQLFDTFYCNINNKLTSCKINDSDSFNSCDCITSQLSNIHSLHSRRLLQTIDYDYSDNYNYISITYSDGITWSDAEDYCETIFGTNLASIHSDDDNNEIYTLISTTLSWIGLNDIDNDGTFIWTDNTDVDYTNWRINEPNGGTNENCVLFNWNGFPSDWVDIKCDNTYENFICNSPDTYSFSDNYVSVTYSNGISYEDAELYCISQFGRHLASIHSDDDNNEISTLVSTTKSWIGFNDIENDGTYVWEDGTDFNYTNWRNNDPNGGTSENCGLYNWGDAPYHWVDIGCTKTFTSFVCNNPS